MFECPLYQDIRHQQPWIESGSITNLQDVTGLHLLQQARFPHACYERHSGQGQTLSKSRTAAGSQTPAWGSSVHIQSAEKYLPGQLAQHSCLPVQLDHGLRRG